MILIFEWTGFRRLTRSFLVFLVFLILCKYVSCYPVLLIVCCVFLFCSKPNYQFNFWRKFSAFFSIGWFSVAFLASLWFICLNTYFLISVIDFVVCSIPHMSQMSLMCLAYVLTISHQPYAKIDYTMFYKFFVSILSSLLYTRLLIRPDILDGLPSLVFTS